MLTSRRSFLSWAATLSSASALRAASPPDQSCSILDMISESEHAAIRAGTSTFDCGPAIQKAIQTGGTIFFPEGRYIVASPVMFQPRMLGRFSAGACLAGEGVGRTVFDDRTNGRALFDFDCGADRSTGFRAIRDVHFKGFTIEGPQSGAATAAIRLRGCFQSSISDVHIVDRPGSGIAIPCLLGDADGSNMIDLVRVRVENCADWGIDAAAAPGCNEISFLTLHHVFVQNCGTRSGGMPTSGGMRYKGQMLRIEQCAFAINQNAGLFIPGEAGLAINIRISSTSFENNLSRHLLCTGVSVFQADNLQFFSSDQYHVDAACEFLGSTHVVRSVVIDGVTVRATAGNTPYVGFRFQGANLAAASCDVRNVIWEDFGYPGQVRFAGSLSSGR